MGAVSRCAPLALVVSDSQLSLAIADDGKGLESAAARPVVPAAAPAGGGNGLKNLQAHAAALGGSCRVESIPGKGVTVTFVVPLNGLRKPIQIPVP